MNNVTNFFVWVLGWIIIGLINISEFIFGKDFTIKLLVNLLNFIGIKEAISDTVEIDR